MVGRQVKRAIAELGLKREDIFISSKVWSEELGYEKTKKAVETSLELFDLGYIDLFFIHFPVNDELPKDYPNHVQDRHESWKALEEFVDAGKIRQLGVSNFLPIHIEDIFSIAKYKPVVNQFEIHPMYVENDTIEYCRKHGIQVQAYSPFAQWNESLVQHPTLVRIAQAHNIDIARTILLWMIHHGFAMLPKSATTSRIASNIQLVGLSLTDQEVKEIDELQKANMPIEWKAHGFP